MVDNQTDSDGNFVIRNFTF